MWVSVSRACFWRRVLFPGVGGHRVRRRFWAGSMSSTSSIPDFSRCRKVLDVGQRVKIDLGHSRGDVAEGRTPSADRGS